MQSQGRYTILGEIAAGGTATVFLAEDSVLRRKVALKKLHPHLLNHPEMVKRFRKEAVAVASLSHENVIKIFDYGNEDKGVFLAMEYVDGLSLDALLREAQGMIPNLAALSLFQQLLDGLAAAHSRGICHRDIKPSNVLIDRKGNVRLADFGIAFLSEETSFTRTGVYLGTPGYSAPEQAEGKTVTEKTDIFAAGTLLYRCLAGRMPFTAGSPHALLKAIVEQAQPKASLVNPRILPGLADLAQDMLAKDPGRRPSARACVQRIQDISAQIGIPISVARVRELVADPMAESARESRELADRLVQSARASERSGKAREALKLYSLAQAHAEGGAGAEAAVRLRASFRRTRWVASAAILALLAGGAALALRTVPRGARPATADSGRPVPAGSVAPGPGRIPAFAHPPAGAAPAGIALAAWRSAGGNSAVTSGDRAAPAPEAPRAPAAAVRRSGGRSRPAAAPPEARAARDPALPSAARSGAPAAPALGYAWIKTNPPFARVRIDGKEIGATPLPAPTALSEGAHTLEIQREGCRTLTREFRVGRADTLVLRLALEREGTP